MAILDRGGIPRSRDSTGRDSAGRDSAVRIPRVGIPRVGITRSRDSAGRDSASQVSSVCQPWSRANPNRRNPKPVESESAESETGGIRIRRNPKPAESESVESESGGIRTPPSLISPFMVSTGQLVLSLQIKVLGHSSSTAWVNLTHAWTRLLETPCWNWGVVETSGHTSPHSFY